MKKKLIGWLLVSLFFYGCKQQATEEKQEGMMLDDHLAKMISIEPAVSCIPPEETILNGQVDFDPDKSAQVYPIFGGTITNVSCGIGDPVKKGQVLAVIKSANVAELEKQKNEADQKAAYAKRNLDAVNDLASSGMSSERELQMARQELAIAKAEQKRLSEFFSLYHITGNSTYEIPAPVSGFVLEKNISENMQLRDDLTNPLFVISGLDDIWVIADVYESDITKIHPGDKVKITTIAYGSRIFEGSIDKISNTLDDNSKTMSARVRLKNEGYLLKPGMYANVYVESAGSGKPVLRIPAHSVIFENGRNYVVVVNTDNSIEKRQVTLYKQTDTYDYVADGLKEGENVVDKNVILVYNAL